MSEAVQTDKYLSANELRRLTEARAASKQLRWLASHRVPCRFDGGRVLVLRVLAEEFELMAHQPEAELPAMLR
jgi:hypothetical protein